MSEARRVLYVCYDVLPSPKGAGTHMRYFVEALASHYEVTVLSPAGTTQGTGSFHGARHVEVALPQAHFLDRALAFREAVWDELERGEYEVAHFRTMWAALPVAEERQRRELRVVCEVNAVESIELKYHYPRLRAHPEVLAKLRAQEDQGLAAADAVVTPSTVTAQYLRGREVPEEKLRVIPNGVDLELFSPGAPRPAGEPLVALYVGTLAPWQGVEFLLAALRRVWEEYPLRLRLLAAGAGHWQRRLSRSLEKLSRPDLVELLSPVAHEEVPALLREADLCVAPLAATERNVVQGCHPLKLLEYLACGKPIVASALPVVRDILTDEADALLYKPTKPRRLAEALLRVIREPELRTRLGEQARRTAEERCGWARAQASLREVYAELLSRPA